MVYQYAEIFWNDQKRNGKTLYDSQRTLRERNYFGALMVKSGDADAMLGELESRMASNEDYETAAQMRDIRKRLNG